MQILFCTVIGIVAEVFHIVTAFLRLNYPPDIFISNRTTVY